jgi:hypothetical protein
MTQQLSADQLAAMNAQNRAAVLQTCPRIRQFLTSEIVGNVTNGTPITRNIPLRNVGLTTKLYMYISFTLAQSAAETLTLTNFGPSNILSNITFADYTNYQRINTTGWHMDALATARAKMPFASAYTTSNPVKTGANYNVKSAPSTVTTAQTIYMMYEIPFAYSETNLQGAIMSQVINGNAYFQFTINPNLVAPTAGNPVQAVYQSSTAATGTITNFQYTIMQEYYDQLPQNSAGQFLIPALDLQWLYGIYNTDVSGIAVNSDNPYSFINYRQYLSTFAIYDNAGVLNAGTDINRFKLLSANMLPLFDFTPPFQKLFERKIIGDDFPTGSYYFDFRDKPISTNQNGNMQLIFNPSVVTSSASVFHLGLEYLGQQNQVAQAGSVLA